MTRLIRHTLEALQVSEWEGARYLLITGLALVHARAVRPGASLRGAGGGCVLQFPALTISGADAITDEAITGMVTG